MTKVEHLFPEEETPHCFHSYVTPDCLGCLHGHIHRMEHYVARLRAMIEDRELLRLHDLTWFGREVPDE